MNDSVSKKSGMAWNFVTHLGMGVNADRCAFSESAHFILGASTLTSLQQRPHWLPCEPRLWQPRAQSLARHRYFFGGSASQLHMPASAPLSHECSLSTQRHDGNVEQCTNRTRWGVQRFFHLMVYIYKGMSLSPHFRQSGYHGAGSTPMPDP